jgi:hypothetical protein
VDPERVSKSASYNESRDYRIQDGRYLEIDVQNVLDAMIFHPRNHTHLKDCGLIASLLGGQALDVQEIRVGGGIENAFVFLFHLRYQFCLVSEETRTRERKRLTDLFTSAIRGRRRTLPPNELFDFQR